MTIAQYANFSNYAIASATVVVALAFLAHIVEWAFAHRVQTADVEVDTGGQSLANEPVADDDYRVHLWSRIGIALTTVTTLVLLAGVIARALATQRAPWGNMYEFGTTGIALLLVIYLALLRTTKVHWLGLFVSGFSLIVLGLSMTVYVPAGPLVPALHSYWLVIHVAAVMLAGALFFIGGALSILFLLRQRFGDTGVWARIPGTAVLDQMAFRAHAIAFPLWTFGTLIAGPIWAQYSWGRYWGWDAKEVWAFITWIIYAGYLHARMTAGWRGKRAAIIALVGFASFISNYVVVNLFLPGLHSYAK